MCVDTRLLKTEAWVLTLRTPRIEKGTQKKEEWALIHETQKREAIWGRRWTPIDQMMI